MKWYRLESAVAVKDTGAIAIVKDMLMLVQKQHAKHPRTQPHTPTTHLYINIYVNLYIR